MAKQIVTATLRVNKDQRPKIDKPLSGRVEYDFGDDLKHAIQLFGPETVFNLYVRAARVAVQSWVKAQLTKKEGDDVVPSDISSAELQKRADEYKLTATAAETKEEREKKKAKSLSDEALIAALRDRGVSEDVIAQMRNK